MICVLTPCINPLGAAQADSSMCPWKMVVYYRWRRHISVASPSSLRDEAERGEARLKILEEGETG